MAKDIDIGKRLLEERKRVGKTQLHLSRLGGVSAKTQSFYENGNSSPDSDYLSFIAPLIDVLYVITGKRNINHEEGMFPQYRDPSVYDSLNQIPLYRTKASAGHGLARDDTYDMSTLSFPKLWFEKRNLTAANLFAVDVEGDSMEPLIPDGSVVLCDKTDITPVNNKIYVFDFGGDLLIKQIVRGNNGYIAVSKNKISYPDPLVIDQTTQSRIIGRARHALPDIKL